MDNHNLSTQCSKGCLATVVLLAGMSLSLTGCGPRTCSVQGTVLWDGQPVPEGRIAFRPMEPNDVPTVQAVIRNGEYSFDSQQGIRPGTYSVVITAMEAG